MGKSKYCISCKRADKGDGIWETSEVWSDKFLDETNENIIKFGKIQHVICSSCERVIKSKGHTIKQF